MYTREEASLIKKEFFTALGMYMRPVTSAGGDKVNWLNYRTGIKHVYLRIELENRTCTTGMLINHPDTTERLEFFLKLQSFAVMLPAVEDPGWIWTEDVSDDDSRMISRIYSRLEGYSVYNRDHWPQLISFIKPRLVALDIFWTDIKDQFL